MLTNKIRKVIHFALKAVQHTSDRVSRTLYSCSWLK